MKNFKITIYNLILIIIILLITLSFCIGIIVNTNKKTNLKKYVAEMELIQEKVNQVRKQYLTWENYNANEPGNFLFYIQNLGYVNANSASNIYINEFTEILNNLNNENTKYWDMNIDSILTNYCYFNPENLKRHFGINTKLNVIINFYTGNVIEKNGIKDINSKVIHRQYDTNLGNKLVTVSLNNDLETVAEVVENMGLSQRIKISFNQSDVKNNISEVFYYTDEIENSKSCTELQDYIYLRDENSVYFTITKSGIYNFFIKDINHREYKSAQIEISLCNKPVLSDGMIGIYWDESGNEITVENENDPQWYNYSSALKFANAKTQEGNYWVWIPRFLYNITEDITSIQFAVETTSKNTQYKKITGYKLQESFNEDDNIYGLWVSKFQVNEDYSGNISSKPGQTLTVTSMKDVAKKLKNYKSNVSIMSKQERNAMIVIANSENINISNDLVHYAGGGVTQNDYILNTKYSSTGNVYGVYDLITSENELFSDSNVSDVGRYRLVLKK